MTNPIEAMCEKLERLQRGATARPWRAFDRGGVRAIMKGNEPPLKANGYHSRKWPEIVAWSGFDGSDVPDRYRPANLHLIVEAVNALPALLTMLRDLQRQVEGLEAALREIGDLHGEINPSNYDHDDACELNRQFCYAQTIAVSTLKDNTNAR